MDKTLTLTLCILVLTLAACTGSRHDREVAARRAAQDGGTHFLREAGINPDTMMIPSDYAPPHDDNWATQHNRWLTIDQITTLGLDQLCDADTATQPIALMSVYPVDKEITAVMLRQQRGHSATWLLLTYNAAGTPIDRLNLGTCAGANERYTSPGHTALEQAHLTAAGRQLTVARELRQQSEQGHATWTATGSDTYEVDQRGHIMHRDANAALDEMDDGGRTSRLVEALTWYSIQDEQALDAIERLLTTTPTAPDSLGQALYQRLLASPWTTAHWLHLHQDSPLVPLLVRTARHTPASSQPIATALQSVPDTAQRRFLQHLLQ